MRSAVACSTSLSQTSSAFSSRPNCFQRDFVSPVQNLVFRFLLSRTVSTLVNNLSVFTNSDKVAGVALRFWRKACRDLRMHQFCSHPFWLCSSQLGHILSAALERAISLRRSGRKIGFEAVQKSGKLCSVGRWFAGDSLITVTGANLIVVFRAGLMSFGAWADAATVVTSAGCSSGSELSFFLMTSNASRKSACSRPSVVAEFSVSSGLSVVVRSAIGVDFFSLIVERSFSIDAALAIVAFEGWSQYFPSESRLFRALNRRQRTKSQTLGSFF